MILNLYTIDECCFFLLCIMLVLFVLVCYSDMFELVRDGKFCHI